MNKKELKMEQHISMKKFLRCYVGVENGLVLNWLAGLTHRELKEVCDELMMLDLTRISFEEVTKENVQKGDVLLVLDSDNNPAPYNNPKQNTFDDIIEEERQRKMVKLKDPEYHVLPFDDYTDVLDDIAFDKGVTSGDIRKLSYRRNTYRRKNEND